jgi:hypothetical protein
MFSSKVMKASTSANFSTKLFAKRPDKVLQIEPADDDSVEENEEAATAAAAAHPLTVKLIAHFRIDMKDRIVQEP